ncbi:hypothetical protein GOP47_0010953 [Adiantum capillus-veneris]|uniref:Uncharacterized protein n=1 Tax=Adiantum capillus-veneris TaxID=13818 RepID=A0A9D4ZIB7_ADICA|nr:hypothetical protein GOP47_0010953 [Adiantum capillus-veneris]
MKEERPPEGRRGAEEGGGFSRAEGCHVRRGSGCTDRSAGCKRPARGGPPVIGGLKGALQRRRGSQRCGREHEGNWSQCMRAGRYVYCAEEEAIEGKSITFGCYWSPREKAIGLLLIQEKVLEQTSKKTMLSLSVC